MKQNGFKPHIGLIPRLWKSFKALETESNLENHVNYYRALATWVKDVYNKRLIPEDIMNDFRLNILIELDPEKHVIDNSGILLHLENIRMFGNERPKHLESLALSIEKTLWDLTTNYSGIDCPDCIYDDGLRYVIAEDLILQKKELILHCKSCEYLQTLDGESLSNNGLTIIPASREDIAEHRK